MRARKIKPVLLLAIFLLGNSLPVQSQESETAKEQRKSRNSFLVRRLSDQDLVLTLSSIEWGAPDRWSFTSRYIHEFDKARNGKKWRSNLSLSVSPGTTGGRVGIGYLSVFSPYSEHEFALLSEFRVVFLRTWRNPLSTQGGRSFIGAELRSGVGFANVGVGFYSEVSSTEKERDRFWGVHLGLGI